MITVALLGAGRIGKIHASSVMANPKATMKYVVDVYKKAADELAAQLSAQSVDLETVFADPEVDLVMICSSTDTHADLIERAARAGKAIFCEKPVDLNLGRVREALQVVANENAKLMVGFNRRFDPNFVDVKQSIVNGEIGEVELVTIISRDPGAPPAEYIKGSGGLFRDMTIHDFDVARWLLGEEPAWVYASAAALTDPQIGTLGDVDTAVVTLTCKSGKMAVITNSRRATYGYDQRIEVHGSDGMVAATNMLESTKVVSNADGVTSQKPMHFFLERYAAAYRNEFAAMVEAIESGAEPNPSGTDGEKSIVLAEAALESLNTGARVAVKYR